MQEPLTVKWIFDNNITIYHKFDYTLDLKIGQEIFFENYPPIKKTVYEVDKIWWEDDIKVYSMLKKKNTEVFRITI